MTLGLEAILENAAKIKLKGGVVGKVSVVLIVVSCSMAVIALSVRVAWVSAIALVLVFILCSVFMWRLINFADKNPRAALLEGAEFLIHEQITLGSKDQPVLQISDLHVQPAPLPLLPTDPAIGEADAPELDPGAGGGSDG